MTPSQLLRFIINTRLRSSLHFLSKLIQSPVVPHLRVEWSSCSRVQWFAISCIALRALVHFHPFAKAQRQSPCGGALHFTSDRPAWRLWLFCSCQHICTPVPWFLLLVAFASVLLLLVVVEPLLQQRASDWRVGVSCVEG